MLATLPCTIFAHQGTQAQQTVLRFILSHGVVDARCLSDGTIRVYSTYTQKLPTGEIIDGISQDVIPATIHDARMLLGY